MKPHYAPPFVPATQRGSMVPQAAELGLQAGGTEPRGSPVIMPPAQALLPPNAGQIQRQERLQTGRCAGGSAACSEATRRSPAVSHSQCQPQGNWPEGAELCAPQRHGLRGPQAHRDTSRGGSAYDRDLGGWMNSGSHEQ